MSFNHNDSIPAASQFVLITSKCQGTLTIPRHNYPHSGSSYYSQYVTLLNVPNKERTRKIGSRSCKELCWILCSSQHFCHQTRYCLHYPAMPMHPAHNCRSHHTFLANTPRPSPNAQLGDLLLICRQNLQRNFVNVRAFSTCAWLFLVKSVCLDPDALTTGPEHPYYV